MSGSGSALITGFPSLRARFILEAVARRQPELSIIALVHPDRALEAESLLQSLDAHISRRVQLYPGNPAGMDFGLAGGEYLKLAERVELVHAAYSVTDPGLGSELSERVNIGAARELIEFSRASQRKLQVILYSSVFVSGNRSGRVLEGELEAGQSFRSAAERTLAIAERMLRRSGIPVSVLRAGHILGDLRTGEVEQLSGPYPLAVLLASTPEERPLSLPLGSDSLLPLTPVDHLAELGAFMASAGIFGRTVHVVDFEGVTLRGFLELCAAHIGRRIDSGFNPTTLTRVLFGNPAARLLPQNARGILEVLTTSAEYDTTGFREIVTSGALVNPPLEAYIASLFEHIRARLQDGTLVSPRRPLAPWLVS